MLIVMKADATESEIANVASAISESGLRPHVLPGAQRTAIGITGNDGAINASLFENLPEARTLKQYEQLVHEAEALHETMVKMTAVAV